MTLMFQLLICPVATLALAEALTMLPGPFDSFAKLRATRFMQKSMVLECYLCAAVICNAGFQALCWTGWRGWLGLTFYGAGVAWVARKIINKAVEDGGFGK